MKGNFHVQFLGEGVAATSPPYPTLGWATTQVYPAQLAANVSVPATIRGGDQVSEEIPSELSDQLSVRT